MTSEGRIWITEPFRVFFPLGVVASIFGVLIWPLFYAGWWPFPPQLQHPRIMIFGFGFAFVTGFLGTAWPRFLEGAALRKGEVLLLVAVWTTAQVFYGRHQLQFGDWSAAAFGVALLSILSLRFGKGRPHPPPGFSLAFGAVFLATAAAASWALFPVELYPFWFLFTKLAAWQGLLLLPLLGIGSYLIPRIFGSNGSAPNRALGVWIPATAVLISFGLEASGSVKLGNLLRFGMIALWAGLAVPVLWKGRAPHTRAWGLRIALGSVALSFLVRGFWPGPGFAIEHLLFISGVGLAMLLVAERVTIGHGGDLSRMPEKSRWWRWLVWLVLIAAATRVSADMKASILVSHHIYAALLWAIVLVMWTSAMFRFWRQSN